MSRTIAVIILLSMLMVDEAGADAASDLRLAKMFSPILILAEETGTVYDETVPIRVIKPEPVEIVFGQSADSLRFSYYEQHPEANPPHEGTVVGFEGWDPPLTFPNVKKIPPSSIPPTSGPGGIIYHRPTPEDIANAEVDNSFLHVHFARNEFAFLTTQRKNFGYIGTPPGARYGLYQVIPHFDYPGVTARVWNDTYFGSGPYSGVNPDRPNTAYVHIDTTTIPQYRVPYGTVTVIQYKYFYPYNDWWNNHEGDWQGIDVVVTSRNPATAKFLGVEYRFHGAWLSYYKDYNDRPGITNSVVFDPQSAVRLIGTHPVAYIGAGSHAAYPIGGEIELHFTENFQRERTEEARGIVGTVGNNEHMSHTGLVLSTLADDTHRDIWESYNLVLLPNPDTTNTNNMGLTPAMSWLGAQIRWGTVSVHGPRIIGLFTTDNESPYGPYNSKTNSWGDLKLFTAKTLPGEDTFHHSDLERTSYHHWAIIGADSLSGTVSLHGDVVVFPGATLTIKAGTIIEFPSQSDRHQFKKGDNRLSEIFVYGTLLSEGTSSNPVALGGTEGKIERWGGIRELGSGSVNLGDYTAVRNTRPVKPVFVRKSRLLSPVAVAVEWEPINDPVISYQTRISPDGTTWPAWSDWTDLRRSTARAIRINIQRRI